MLASLALLVLPLLAPLASANADIAAAEHHLEARATRSKDGWYSYGCYFDCYNGMNRYLPHFAYADENNNPEMCISACKGAGFDYAGLQFTKECWCGSEGGKALGQSTKPTDCFYRCKNGAKCGGPCRNNVWSVHEKKANH